MFNRRVCAKRMMSFAWQSVASMMVALIVWDRSEVILLKYLCADIRQVAYYSVAFSMAERAADQLTSLRVGGRRNDLCSVRARQIQDFPPLRLPLSVTLR